jgi:hypothetical protein
MNASIRADAHAQVSNGDKIEDIATARTARDPRFLFYPAIECVLENLTMQGTIGPQIDPAAFTP